MTANETNAHGVKSRSLMRTLAVGFGASGVALGLGALLNVASVGLLIRNLTASDYGRFATVSAEVLILSFLFRFGLDRFAFREIRAAFGRGSQREATTETVRALAMSAATAFLAGGLLTLGSLAGAFPFLRLDLAAAVAAGFWVASEVVRPVVAEVLRANLFIAFAAIVSNALRAAAFLFLVAVLASSADTLDILVSAAVASILATMLGLVRLTVSIRQPGQMTPAGEGGTGDERSNRRTLIHYTIAGVAALLIGAGDIWVAGTIGGAESAAAYAPAVALSGAIALVMTVVNAAVQPFLADAVDETERGGIVVGAVRASATVGFSLAIPTAAIAVGLGFAAAEIGSEVYTATGLIVLILSIGQLFGVAMGPCGTLLLLVHREERAMRILAAVAAVTIGLEVLTMHFTSSVYLLAVVSSLAVVVSNLLLERTVEREFGFSTRAYVRVHAFRGSLSVLRRSRETLDGAR